MGGGLTAVPQGQGVKRNATRLDVHPSELTVTGGTECVEAGLVAQENVEAG